MTVSEFSLAWGNDGQYSVTADTNDDDRWMTSASLQATTDSINNKWIQSHLGSSGATDNDGAYFMTGKVWSVCVLQYEGELV